MLNKTLALAAVELFLAPVIALALGAPAAVVVAPRLVAPQLMAPRLGSSVPLQLPAPQAPGFPSFPMVFAAPVELPSPALPVVGQKEQPSPALLVEGQKEEGCSWTFAH